MDASNAESLSPCVGVQHRQPAASSLIIHGGSNSKEETEAATDEDDPTDVFISSNGVHLHDDDNDGETHHTTEDSKKETESTQERQQRRRLDLNRIRHCGRKRQLDLLNATLKNVSSSSADRKGPSSRGILIEAESGAGKTKLLEYWMDGIKNKNIADRVDADMAINETTASSNSTWICYGKFEERTSATEPFGAIRDAMKGLFEYIKIDNRQQQQQQRQQEDVEFDWARRIRRAVDFDIHLIEEIIPEIRSVLLYNRTESSLTSSERSHPSRQQGVIKGDDSYGDDGLCGDGDNRDSSITHDDTSIASSIDFEAFGNMNDKEWRFERFRLAFRALFRCLSNYRTIVMVLDDVHWCDPDSISLIRTLLQDSPTTESKNKFLFVGASRPRAEYQFLASWTRELLSTNDGGTTESLTVVPLKPLTVEDVARILADILELTNDNDVFCFAEIIHTKTGGNAFVIIQFLRLLEEKNLIYYSDDEARWLWDSCRINAEVDISNNVNQIVAERLDRVDRRRRSALMTAASFRVSNFDLSTVAHAMVVLGDNEEEPFSRNSSSSSTDHYSTMLLSRSLKEVLDAAAAEGFLQIMGDGKYRFTHDRIREAAYSLLPDGTAGKEMHLRIGRQLRRWMDERSELGLENESITEESLLMNATKQLNLGVDLITDEWERLDLAELNYRAAEIAAKKASFYPSLEYLQAGLSHLGDLARSWDEHYSLTLKLTVTLARMQYSCGLFEECINSADLAVLHAKAFSDKESSMHTKAICLMQMERQAEAESYVISILDSLGEPYPRKFEMFHIVRGFVKNKRLLKGLLDKDILSIRKADDYRQLQYSVPFMERLAELSFLGGKPTHIMLFSVRLVQMLLERGSFPLAGAGINVWGFLQVKAGFLADGLRYGRLAIQMFDRESDIVAQQKLRTQYFFWTFIAHWQLPLHKGLEPVLSAFAELWQIGALDYYHMAYNCYLRLQFGCGEPLSDVLCNSKKYSESLLDYKHLLHWNTNAPLHQAVLNFMGKSTDPSILNGEHIDVVECQMEWKKTSNRVALFQCQLFGMIVAYYFQNFKLAEHHAKQSRKDIYEDGPDILVPLRLFYTSLVYHARFRETRKRSYMQSCEKILRQFRKWVDDGAVNCNHMDLILKAELLSASPTASKANIIEAYDQAISSSADSGMRQHNALVNELAGSYLCGVSDLQRARPYLEKALDLYREWEASAKVEDIETRFKNVFDSNTH